MKTKNSLVLMMCFKVQKKKIPLMIFCHAVFTPSDSKPDEIIFMVTVPIQMPIAGLHRLERCWPTTTAIIAASEMLVDAMFIFADADPCVHK